MVIDAPLADLRENFVVNFAYLVAIALAQEVENLQDILADFTLTRPAAFHCLILENRMVFISFSLK